jgi:hypothetical protein
MMRLQPTADERSAIYVQALFGAPVTPCTVCGAALTEQDTAPCADLPCPLKEQSDGE